MVVDHICVNYGAELFTELFNALQHRGVEQRVFYPRNRKHRIADPIRSYRIDSPLVLDLSTKASFRRKQQVMRGHYDLFFQQNKPDLIHAHTLFSDGSLANHYHKSTGTPFVVAIRSTDLDVFLKYKPWLLPLGRQIAANAQNIIFISPSLRRKFLRKFGSAYESKSLIIPNGINQSFFDQEPVKNKEFHTPLKLLYIGSFLKRKNVPALIKLLEHADYRLTLVGAGGKDEKKVLRMIRNSGKTDYLGRVEDPAALSQIYRQHDIFIMSSRRETFGLVYAEAMSQGLPLIYSINTGIDGLFERGRVGFGVKPGSVPQMLEAIEKIAADYQEISKNCIAEAKQLNWTDIADRYLDLYRKATG